MQQKPDDKPRGRRWFDRLDSLFDWLILGPFAVLLYFPLVAAVGLLVAAGVYHSWTLFVVAVLVALMGLFFRLVDEQIRKRGGTP